MSKAQGKRARKVASATERAESFLTGDIFNAPSAGLFGHIDAVTPDGGIEGWVLDCAAPGRALTLELMVSGEVIATTRAERARGDIEEILKAPCTPGFHFSASVFEAIRAVPDNAAALALRVAGEPEAFDLSGLFPTVGACKRLWVEQRLARLSRTDVAHAEASSLIDRLETLSEQALTMAERPLFPVADLRLGRIEAFHAAGAGALWLVGWMRRDTPSEFPAVVVDKRRYPGAITLLKYERADLPSDHVGIIAFCLTNWKPAAGNADFHIYIDEVTNAHVSAAPGVRALSGDDILGQLESVRNAVTGGAVAALRALLASGNNWMPNNARAIGIPAEAALDKVVIVPGFGAFVEGWAICPTRRAKAFALKIGDCILHSDPQTTYFRERADLAGVFPDGALYTARAGFGAVLHGPVTQADIGTALLKVIYTEGTSSVHTVDARVMRRFSADEDSQPLLQQWPALEYEAFFPALARAIHRDWSDELQAPSEALRSEGRTALAMVLPQNASNMRACFESLSRNIFENTAPECFVFLAQRRETRSETLRLVNELIAERGVKASLFFLDDDRTALALLPHVLGRLGVERFVFVDQGLLLTPGGWRAAVSYLDLDRRAPLLLGLVDQRGDPDRIGGALGAACFGWELADFSAWYQGATLYVPGPAQDASFCRDLAGAAVFEKAALRIEQRRAPRLVELVDAALHADTGASA